MCLTFTWNISVDNDKKPSILVLDEISELESSKICEITETILVGNT